MTGSDDLTATDPNKVDAIKLSLMLADLRLPTINQLWKSFAKRADAEGWTAARFLAALAEHELAERDRRRIERHLREARLLPGKSLASFDFKAVPMLAKAQVMALAAGDGWLNQGANCLVFGPPGAGKSHLASAIGLALVENGYRVLFTRTTDLVQHLQVARRELALESQLARLDRYRTDRSCGRSATICVCRAATINETRALAIPYRARNHAPAAGAGNLTLIDARLSSRSSRYTGVPGSSGRPTILLSAMRCGSGSTPACAARRS